MISLNPKLRKKGVRKTVSGKAFLGDRHSEDWQEKSVAGLVQELPFKDNTFDAVVSHMAIPQHLRWAKEELIQSFREVVRVLKPGGKGYFAPIVKSLHQSEGFINTIQELSDLADFKLEAVLEWGGGWKEGQRMIIIKK